MFRHISFKGLFLSCIIFLDIISNQNTLVANLCPNVAFWKRELDPLTGLEYNENWVIIF